MRKSATTLIDQEVFNSLRHTLDIAVVRSSNEGIISMSSSALSLFGFRSMEDARFYPRKMMFADSDVFYHVTTKLNLCGHIHNERILFKKNNHTNFWGKLTSIQKIVNHQVVFDEQITDITSEVEQEHRLAEKSHLLEKVSSELDRFIYSASHDLRSPITTALGLVHLMKLCPASINVEYFEMMEQALRKLESNVQKLVDFSKNVNERVICEKIDFKKQLHNALAQLSHHSNYKKMLVDYEVMGDVMICSDTSKIKNILYQIIKNSLEYIDPNKSKSFISIRFFQSVNKCRIEILDNGMGIQREHLPHVFQMFYRATASSIGPGLGLYVVKEAITLINGSIEMESEYGIGTTITITIPNLRDKQTAC